MTKAVINIENKEMAAGWMHFLALSRLKSVSGLLIQPMPFARLENIGRLKRMQQHIIEEERLKLLTQLCHITQYTKKKMAKNCLYGTIPQRSITLASFSYNIVPM